MSCLKGRRPQVGQKHHVKFTVSSPSRQVVKWLGIASRWQCYLVGVCAPHLLAQAKSDNLDNLMPPGWAQCINAHNFAQDSPGFKCSALFQDLHPAAVIFLENRSHLAWEVHACWVRILSINAFGKHKCHLKMTHVQ